jgi:2-hydroxychromene-2-carboxylate isomerase
MADPRLAGGADADASHPVFYYDLSDPISYLAAERINATLAVVAEWEPVLGAEVGVVPNAVDRPALERRAADIGALPFRWWPRGATSGNTAALAATYAKQIGRTVAFSLAAFRQAFAGGHDLDLESTVLLAGAACELHPRALLQAISRPAIGAALQSACDRARLAGVRSLPAIEVRGSLFSGDDAVEQAAAQMTPPGGPPSASMWPPSAPQGSVADH